MNQKQINTAGRIGYFLLSLTNAFSICIPTFLILFGTNVLGIKIALISLLMALVKITDGISDVLAGLMIDATHHKNGKARPWLLWMCVPYGLCFAAQFWIPPTWGMGLKAALLMIFYFLTVTVFGTVVGIAVNALLPRMSTNGKELASVGSICGAAGVTLTGFLMAFVFPLQAKLGFAGTFTLFGGIVFLLTLVGYALVRELPYDVIEAATKSHGQSRVTIGAMVSNLARNKYALLMFVYTLVIQTAGSFIMGCGTYYAIYALGSQAWYTKFMLCGSFGSLAGMFVGRFLVTRIGAKMTYIIGCLLAAVGFFTIRLTGDNPIIVIVLFFFILMGGQVLTNGQSRVLSMQAVDYGEWKNHERGEGLVSSTGNVGNKIGSAVGTSIMGLLLGAAGFVEGGVAQTAEAIQGVKLVYTVGTPVIYLLLAVIVALTWGLEKKIPDIRAELAERRAAAKK